MLMVGALRSFLRYLRLRGDIALDLAEVVPSVPDWRLAHLPKSIAPDEVERLLRAVDRSHPTGQRDYAVLLLLARLGLRAGEVVAMTLEDIDWEGGELLIHSKGGQQDRLPLLQDVGQALASYLREARPRCATRRVFVTMKAPRRGFAGPGAVCTIVRHALQLADLHPPRKGAHLLRHSLATGMLRRGASLAEIGEILRHRLPNTTQIYAKVDLDALRAIAPPWPGGAK
jgi:site-specific recombinase XerD